MKPLIWRNTQDVEPDGHALFDNTLRKTDSYIFMSGRALPCPDIGTIQYSQDPKKYDLTYTYRYSESHLKRFDCFPNTGQSPLVNQKALDILNKLCPDDIQAFPATIVSEPGSKHEFTNHDYWVINITKNIDPIDHNNTVFSYTPKSLGGNIIGAKKLRFLDKEITGIARNKLFSSLKIVSPSIAQAFKEANVTGVEFIEDKDY